MFAGSQGEKYLYALYDSEANLSCIHPIALENLEVPVALGRARMIGTAAEGHYIEVNQRVSLDFIWMMCCFLMSFWLSPA